MHLHQCSHVAGVNLKAFLFQVGCSGKSSSDIGLDGRDGGPELALLDEGGGGLLVQSGDGVGDDDDVALHRGCLSRQNHRFVLQLVVTSGGGGELVLGSGELGLAVVAALGQSGLGAGQRRLQARPLVVDPSDSVIVSGVGSFEGVLGGDDLSGLLSRKGAEELDLALRRKDLRLQILVGGSSGLALGSGGSQDGLELGQAFGHLPAALLFCEFFLEDAHLSLDHGVVFIPRPIPASVVETDVPLDGGDALLLGDLALVGDVDEDAASLGLHLDDDLGQSAFTDLLQLGQHARAEHDLGPAATEGVRVHAGVDEGLLGALLRIPGQIGEDLGGDDGVAGHEVGVGHLVGQTQHTDADTLQHAVAVELVHDERSIDVSRLLDLVGDDATHEVRMGGVQVGHQLHQGLSVGSGNGHHGSTLLLGAVILLLEDEGDDGVASLSHHASDGLVDGILVLEEPASDIVSDGTGVVVDLKVSLGLALLGGLGLAKGLVLAQVLAHHLLQVGLVGSLGDDALFLKHGQDAHLLLNQLDGDDQVHTKVDESPLNAFSLVLFLLLDEHVVVEELLETLIGVVDQKLLQDVELEDLKAGDVQDTDEVLPGVRGVQGVVDKKDDPIEHTGEEGLGGGGDGKGNLLQILTLLDKILADLQLGLHERINEVVDLDFEQLGSPGDPVHAIGLSLLLTSLLLPLLVAQVGDSNGALVQTILLLLSEAKGVQGGVGGAHLLGIIHTGDGQHTLGDEEEIAGEGLVTQQAHLPVLGVSIGHQLVEDVVISLDLKLEGDTGLLQKVGLDIGGSDFVGGTEVNTDELTEAGRVVVTDGLGVTVGLQRRVGLNNLLLKGTGVGTLGGLGLGGLGIGAVQGVVLQDFLCVLGLAGA